MKKGFTLIELMIVIAIIGIVAAIVLPMIQKHKLENRPSSSKYQPDMVSPTNVPATPPPASAASR